MKECEHGMAASACDLCERQHLEEMLFSRREQRRYEIARDVMAAMESRENGYATWQDQASDAVAIADALLAELERTDGD